MKHYLLVLGSIGALACLSLLTYLAYTGGVPVLMPSGYIGHAERDLMFRTLFLMLIVVVPVYILIVVIAWRYRASNHKAKYTPNWEHSVMEEFIWWAIPFEVVLVLGALTWSSTHALDPEKLLTSAQPPLTVQVVALPWKWLFIYPEEGIASVNELTIPTNRPVTFQITADAPMNSFWIPALGGQMYAMTGMTTNLNLMASESGTYVGKSANYSGEGFAHMNFAVRAVSPNEFATWVTQTRTAPASLTETSYRALAAPGEVDGVRYYGSIMIPFAEIVHRSMQMMR